MRMLFGILASAAGIYSILIFLRIIFSWFGGMVSGKPVEILNKLTDPYLNWWRQTLNLRIGFLDFSVIAAIVCLYAVQRIFNMLAVSDRVTIGSILAIILISLWSIASFIIGFFMIIIILRAVAYLTSRNIYSPFWSAVESISQPIMYRMNRLFFGNKIGGYLKGIIFSLILLAVIMLGGRFLVNLLANFLFNLQI